MSDYNNELNRALFLDRDGVINIDKGYVHTVDRFIFMDGIFEFCRAAVNNKMLLVIVTNQAGIGRGIFSEEDFCKLTKWMVARFMNEKLPISAVYFCPDHPIHGIGPYRKESNDRKPNPGMFFRAQKDLSIDLMNSIMIGDKETDILAARAAGIKTTLLFNNQPKNTCASFRVSNLNEAVKLIFR